MKPLVSILIPAYNAQAWIADTIKSALAQTWERKEIIVVDDGSKDQTLAVARKFASKEVSVLTQENQGAAAARNCALRRSQGDFIQWLDADDLLAPDKIERQVQVYDRSGGGRRTLLSSAWGRFYYRPERVEERANSLWEDLSPLDWLTRKLAENVYMQTACWLVTRELSEAAGPWDTRMLVDDDGEYFCRVILNSSEIKFVGDAHVMYRISGSGTLSHLGSNTKLDAQFESMRLHIGYIRSIEDNERVRSACIRYLQTGLEWFYPNRQDIVIKACALAEEMGGALEMPKLRPKYEWMKSLVGWRVAKRAQMVLPEWRNFTARLIDRTMFQLGW